MLTNLLKFNNRNSDERDLRFVGIFLCAAVFFVILIFFLSVLVDPRGIFGTNLVRPIVITNRTSKLAALAKKDPPPEAIIFGSSRTFKTNPARVKELTDLATYNASVSFARPEEHLAMAHYIVENLHIKPKLFIVGVNVGEFNNDPTYEQTTMNPALRKYLPITKKQIIKTVLRTFKDSVSPTYLRDIGLALFFQMFGHAPKQVVFDENGYERFDPRAPLEPYTARPALLLFSNTPHLNQARIQYFESFLNFAKENGSKVIVFITPMPPSVIETISRETSYQTVYHELLNLFEREKNNNLLTYYDFSDISKFGGLPDGFEDSTHPSYQNLDIIIDKIFSTKNN